MKENRGREDTGALGLGPGLLVGSVVWLDTVAKAGTLPTEPAQHCGCALGKTAAGLQDSEVERAALAGALSSFLWGASRATENCFLVHWRHAR